MINGIKYEKIAGQEYEIRIYPEYSRITGKRITENQMR